MASGGRIGASVDAPAAGPVVRARRRKTGLTQQALADAVGVSRQTVLSMESGRYAPSVYLALAVARELGTSVEALWGPQRSPTG